MQVHHMFFTPKSSYYAHIAKLLLHQTTFATEYVYTSNLVHRRTFTPENLEHKGHFKPKNFYRRRLVQQNPFAPVNLFYRPENILTTKSKSQSYIVNRMGGPVTPEDFYTRRHQKPFAPKSCYSEALYTKDHPQQLSSPAILSSHPQQPFSAAFHLLHVILLLLGLVVIYVDYLAAVGVGGHLCRLSC